MSDQGETPKPEKEDAVEPSAAQSEASAAEEPQAAAEDKPVAPPKDALVDLTALSFGPSWAKPGSDKKSEPKPRQERQERRDRGEREERRDGDRRRGGRDRRDGDGGRRRDGGGGGGRDRRDGGRGRRDGDRRQDGRGKRFDKGGRGRRFDDRPPREVVQPPEGVTAKVMPVEEGLDALAKEIMAGGRTYQVFDLAKMVMGARERFNVGFRSKGERRFFKCKRDGSVWLTKAEAISHFWAADWRHDFYEEVATDAEPPKGNFQQVAKCGMSGEILGPPNYHAYQTEIVRMHRERFSHMSIDAYRSKIRMERDEEVVNAWLEKMSKRIEYRPTGGKPKVVKEEVPAEEATPTEGEVEAPAEAAVEEPPAAEEEPPSGEPPAEEEDHAVAEALGVEAAPPEPEPEQEQEQEPEPEPGTEPEPEPEPEPAPLLPDAKAVEQHFIEHHFKDAYVQVERAWVSGGIPGNQLSPGLLTLLRDVVAEERRYPSKLTPMLCRQLSGRHVAVFKWRKKLKAGPSRPHSIPTDIVLADRPQALLDWLVANSGKNLDALWKDVLPEDADEKTKHEWYHDLHWVLNQGYGLLSQNGVLYLAKGGEGLPAKKAAKKAAAKAAKATPVRSAPRGTAGLYALKGKSLSGEPKAVEGLCGKGLWPQPGRLIADEPEEEDEWRDPILG